MTRVARNLGYGAFALLPISLGILAKAQAPATSEQAKAVKDSIIPFVKQHCVPCHSGKTAAGGFEIPLSLTVDLMRKAKGHWHTAAERALAGTMPPPGSPKIPAATVRKFVDSVGLVIGKSSSPKSEVSSGATIRRLNRTEYNNTIRDLFPGIGLSPADDFPSDDVGEGFDNLGAVLSLSPLLMERYIDAADKVVSKAIRLPLNQTRAFAPDSMQVDGGANVSGVIGMFATARATFSVKIDLPGSYRLRVRAYAQQAGNEYAKMGVRLNKRHFTTFEVRAVGASALYEAPMALPAGTAEFELAFINDFYNPQHPDPKQRDRNLYIESAEVVGPTDANVALPPSHRAIMIASPEPGNPGPAAQRILSSFAHRAYRRPISKAELDRMVELVTERVKSGASFERGIQVALMAILCSPNFLFRTELDGGITATRKATSTELASRLSYFLWSSTPDAELQNVASTGTLIQPAVLAKQVVRMLADPKAEALTSSFASQWLLLRKLDQASPDPKLFPEFNESLRNAMKQETEQFFRTVLADRRPITDFIDSDYAFVNEPLAKLYGIPGVTGNQIRKVLLAGGQRGGLLTQASVLTVTSNPNRTSPVKRGKYVLEQILGDPPPPPPPGAGAIEGDTDLVPSKTIKERLARHRRDPNCSSCHLKMDVMGFAFENFDAIGKWRTKDGEFPVETSGVMPDGTKVENVQALKKLLLKDKDAFTAALAKKLMIYALGRVLDSRDDASIKFAAAEAKKNGYRLDILVKSVASSPSFLERRGKQ